ncbi:MAG: Arc family DNA-binding protein [Halopseudomonas sabulinigri]
MASTDSQFKLRLPEALEILLAEAADANRRSKTAETLSRLEQSFIIPIDIDSSATDASLVHVVLGLDRKLTALCQHLGVKLDS